MNLLTNFKVLITTFLVTASIASFAADLGVKREITVNASPATTWKMIGDFNHLDVWHPVVVASELTQGNSQATGAIRVLTLGNGDTITEKLVALNNEDKTYSYAITASKLPVANYVGTITVKPAENGQSVITWSSTFDAATDVSDRDAIDGTAGIYVAGLTSIQKHFQ